MKKIICVLLSFLLVFSSVAAVFAHNDPREKDKNKGRKITVNVNDNTTGNSFNQFQYTGSWNYGKQGGAYQQDNHWSKTKDSYYTVTFYGGEIRLYAAKANNHGIAAISIDGGREKLVDLYSFWRSDNTLIYCSNNLKEGSHILKVRVSGKKNKRSKDSNITADRVEIKTYDNITYDSQAPSAPAGLTGTTVSASQINLNWNASSDNVGVNGYKVYRNGAQIGTVTNGTSYCDKGLHPGTYLYAVTAFDAAGNTSGFSNYINVSTWNQMPSNLALNKPAASDSEQSGYNAAKGNDGSLSTIWCAADGAANHWWKVDLGGYYNISGTEVTWQFGQKLYKYRIDVSQDNVNWTAAVDKTNNTNTEITQADAFSAGNIRFVRITVTGVPAECWAAFYEFKVMGSNILPADAEAPSIPYGLSASPASSGKIDLRWNASTDNVRVAGYKVFRNGTQVGTVTNGTSYGDAGLTPNTTYSYTVSAFDAAGNNSAQSYAVNASTCPVASANISQYKPASSDSILPGYSASYGNDGSLSTMWCAADSNPNHWWQVDLGGSYNLTGTEVTWQFGQKLYKYTIQVSADGVNWTYKVDKNSNTDTRITQKDTFSADSVRYVRINITGVPSECWAAFYEFKVMGVQSGTADTQAPSVPGSLFANPVSPTQVNLNWTPSADNVGVQGYKVYRDSKQIGTVLNGNSYSDTGLQPGKTYKYSVSAFDRSGNNSEKSTTISVITPTPAVSNLALNKTSYTDSQEAANPAQRGNDGSLSTRWAAANGSANHWWEVDLGAAYNLTGTEITWELPDKAYRYKIEVSADNVNWTVKVDKTGNSKKQQVQKDEFTASSVRYVRITVTGFSSNCWSSFYELKVFGY